MTTLKILIIDDSQDITKMMNRYLNYKGVESTVSNDGIDGLRLIKSQSFDKILLDISMPEFSGIDIIESLEKENLLREKKIIVITANNMSKEEFSDLSQKEGIIAIFKKPFELNELLQYMKNE